MLLDAAPGLTQPQDALTRDAELDRTPRQHAGVARYRAMVRMLDMAKAEPSAKAGRTQALAAKPPMMPL